MKVKGQTEAKKTDQESKKKEDKKKNGVKQQQENIKKSKESLSAPQRDPATLILQNRYSKQIIISVKFQVRDFVFLRLSQHPVYQLSVGQICVGILAVLTQLIISICNDVHLNLSTIGEGFFCGVVFITVGCLGLFTSFRVNMFTVRSFMFSNISALIFALLLLVLSSCLLVDILWYQEEDNYAQSGFYILKTLISFQIILSIIEIMLSVTCCSLCYKSYCLNTAGTVATHR